MIKITKYNYKDFLDKNGKPSSKKMNANNIMKNVTAEQIYLWDNNIEKPVCECGNLLSYCSWSFGYRSFCSTKCSRLSKSTENKKRETCLKKYGVEHSSQSEEVKQSTQLRYFENHGVYSPFQNENVKSKIKATNIERYGYENPAQNEDIKSKMKATNIKRYGYENPFQNENVKSKIKATNIERYGYENPAQNEDIKSKIAISLRNGYNMNNRTDCYLYLVENNKHIKIGITKNPNRRLKELKKDFGDECEFILKTFYKNASGLEFFLHNEYRDYTYVYETGNGRTEWFSKEIKDNILNQLTKMIWS